MPVSDKPIVARHYAAQKAIALQVERELAAAGLSGARARATAALLVAKYAPASVAVARNYYADMRDAAGVKGRFVIPVTRTESADLALAYLDAAAAGEKFKTPESTDLFVARTASMMVSNAGRGQVFTAMRADEKSRRWARVTAGGSCAFCLMLATRGAVYRLESTADFQAHRGCHCSIEPIFYGGKYEPPAHIRQAQSTWSETTDGLHNTDALNAFRRAVG